MNLFRIPHYLVDRFNPGQQIYNPGTGGPQSYMGLQAQQPVSWPTVYAVGLPGIGAMPRQVIGVSAPIYPNQYSTPDAISNLEIRGLMKPVVGG